MSLAPDRLVPVPGVPFARDLARHGDRRALVHADGDLSYAALAQRVADRARELGGPRRLVLVEVRPDVGTVVSYLAALAAGHPVLLADGARPDVVAGLVDGYDPDVVVAGDEVRERRRGTAHLLHPDLAVLLSTSGSTGSPRLVRLSAENLQANAEAIADYLPVRPDDLAATTLPLHYCYGLSVLHTHLLRGAALLLTRASVVDPCFWEAARTHRLTSLAGVPHTFEMLDRVGLEAVAPSSLRYLTVAGGAMPPDRVRAYAELGQRRGFDLFVMYGQTEATARMAYLPPDLAAARPAAVGVPVPGGRFSLDPVPGRTDDVGELVYEGPNVMLGYAASPGDLARGREVDRLRTGDLARRAEDGLWEVVGRLGRTAKVLGVRVDLDRVEQLLAGAGWPALAVAAVRDGREGLVVAVEQPPADHAGAGRPRSRAREHVLGATGLPSSAVEVLPVAALPRTSAGKPDRSAVHSLAASGDRPEPADPGPRGPDRSVRAVLARTLDLPDGRALSDGDTFAGLGGDSLSYVETSVRLEQVLGHLPPDWHLRPVADLEAVARGGGRRRRLRTVETNVVLRAAAVVAVVGTHANLFVLAGGAHLLLAVAGFNLARFRLTDAPRATRCRSVLTGATRVAVPALVWIGGATLLLGAYPWQTALLVNGLLGPPDWAEPAWHHWFVEALVVLVLGVAALLAVPALDRWERARPFWFPVGLTLLALLTRYEVVVLQDGDVIHRASAVAWLFTLGWAVARARTRGHRLVVSALAVLSVPGFFEDEPARSVLVVVGLLLLTWSRQVRLPAAAAGVCAVLAAASLHVYLSHWQVYPHLEDDHPLAATLLSLLVGVAVWRLARAAERSLARLRATRSRSGWSRPGQRPAVGGEVRATSPASSTGRAPGTTETETGVPTA